MSGHAEGWCGLDGGVGRGVVMVGVVDGTAVVLLALVGFVFVHLWVLVVNGWGAL